jgi:hypothetical protein
MSALWSLLTVTIGPVILAFLFNTLAPEIAKKIAEKMAGPLSDHAIDWFCRRFPKAGQFLFRKNPAEPQRGSEKPMVPVWYYAEGTARRGPVTAAELRGLYSVGKLLSTTMVWREGMSTWGTLASVEDELPAPPKVKIDLPPKQFSVGPGGVFLGLFILFFVLLLTAVVGASLAVPHGPR